MGKKTNLLGKSLYLNNLGVPVQYGKIKTNPNKEENNFGLWVLLNATIIFFVITILLNNVIIGSITWILNLLSIRFVAQFLLFGIVLFIDIIIMSLVKNMNVINAGILTTLAYYLLDYLYLSKELMEFSLLNADFSS